MATWRGKRRVSISGWIGMRGDLKDLKPYVARAVEVDSFAWCFSHIDVGNLLQTSAITQIQTSHFQINIWLPLYGKVDCWSWRWFCCRLQ